MPSKQKQKVFITDGTVVGRLTVGDLVRDISTHPLYELTPISYLRQGRLREVHCECGEVRLVAESILSTGRLQSCGCLRTELRMAARERGVANLQKKAEKARVRLDIQILQAQLRLELAKDVRTRDEKKVDRLASELRKLFARKGVLGRKETHKETWANVTRPRQLDKLLEDPDDVTSSNHVPQEQPE